MATTKATTLAHTLGGISGSIETAEINRLDGLTDDIQTQITALDNAKAPKASPQFTGTITGTGAEGASASLYLVADEGDDNGDGWRINSNQDVNDLTISNNTSGSYVDKLTLASNGDVTVGNLKVDTIEGDTLYYVKHYQFFPYYDAYQINTGSSSWSEVTKLFGQWGNGVSVFQKTFSVPPAGFTEKFYLGVTGGPGSNGSANLRIKMDFYESTGGTVHGEAVSETQIASGWNGASNMFHLIEEIGSVSVSGVTTSIRTFLSSGSNRHARVFFKNTYGAGNVGISQVWIEQRIYFS